MKHKIITMLGSGKFRTEHQREAKRLTLEGNLVIPFVMYQDTDAAEAFDPKNQPTLRSICDQKVQVCDAVFVINPGGYIGSRTAESIAYAKSLGKEILYLEPLETEGIDN